MAAKSSQVKPGQEMGKATNERKEKEK